MILTPREGPLATRPDAGRESVGWATLQRGLPLVHVFCLHHAVLSPWTLHLSFVSNFMFNANYKSVWMSVQSFGFLNLVVCWILLECFVGAAFPVFVHVDDGFDG